MMWCILDENKNVVPATEEEMIVWKYKNFQHKACIVAKTTKDGYDVSTVFLGENHSFDNNELEVFETMIFHTGQYYDLYCRRYATWTEAEEGHKQTVEKLHSLITHEE